MTSDDPILRAHHRLLDGMTAPLQTMLRHAYEKGLCDGLEASVGAVQSLATDLPSDTQPQLTAAVMTEWARQAQAAIQIESTE